MLMSEGDIAAAGLHEGQKVALVSDFADGKRRSLLGLEVRAHKLPRGTIAAYYLECNVLNAIDHHDACRRHRPPRLSRSGSKPDDGSLLLRRNPSSHLKRK